MISREAECPGQRGSAEKEVKKKERETGGRLSPISWGCCLCGLGGGVGCCRPSGWPESVGGGMEGVSCTKRG